MIRDVYNKNAKCELCGDSGVIIYTKKINDIVYDYVSKCKCKKSLKFNTLDSYYCCGMNDTEIINQKKKNLIKIGGKI